MATENETFLINYCLHFLYL